MSGTQTSTKSKSRDPQERLAWVAPAMGKPAGAQKDRNAQDLTNLLVLAVRYALEQKEAAASMRALALTDELTGLLNRRGFFTLAKQQLRFARRTRRRVLLVFADVNGLKAINDTFGHHEGDRVLGDTAQILRKTFRDSDIIARLGGDEFVIFASEAPLNSERAIVGRLQKQIEAYNAGREHGPCALSLSVGFAPFDSDCPASVEVLMRRADSAMYSCKNGSSTLTTDPNTRLHSISHPRKQEKQERVIA